MIWEERWGNRVTGHLSHEGKRGLQYSEESQAAKTGIEQKGNLRHSDNSITSRKADLIKALGDTCRNHRKDRFEDHPLSNFSSPSCGDWSVERVGDLVGQKAGGGVRLG